MKAGYVSLIGRPNAGKSTLMNALVGDKVAITSNKPQTTRKRILGVANVPGGQMAFLDTPGIHKPMHRLNQRMVDAARDALRDADVTVLVVDVTEPPGTGDQYVLDLLERVERPVILALNKVDALPPKRRSELLPLIAGYSKAARFAAIVPVSAQTKDGLAALTAEILAALPEGEPLFPEDYLTDQTVRSMAAEMVREKVLRYTRDELPYSTAVVIEQWEDPVREGGLTTVHAAILVDGPSQKPIVIGKGGAMIKRIGSDARKDLERLLGGKVFLNLHVKVKADWRDDVRILDDITS